MTQKCLQIYSCVGNIDRKLPIFSNVANHKTAIFKLLAHAIKSVGICPQISVHKYANFISSLTLGIGPIRTQKAIKAKLVRVLCESTNEPDSGEIRRHLRTYASHISFVLKKNSKTTWNERNMSVT